MDKAFKLLRGIGNVLRTHYPDFALGLPLKRAEIPIFTYHDVEPESFAADLEYLRRNAYETLGLEEFVRRSANKEAGGKAVLITFDDARKSFFTAALPVLKDFGAHATLFAPSYWMAGDARAVVACDDLFMSWEQLRICVDSGLVDVQSHAHRHALVYTSDRLVGFASPAAIERYDIYDWPMRNGRDAELLGRPPLGSPIYTAAPLLSASGRYLESAELNRACARFVEQAGGASFFARPQWAAELRTFHAVNRDHMRGHYLADAEFRALVASEFEHSREEFCRHLGYAPAYLAYPWMLGSQLSLELAKRAGIRATFGVALDYGRARSPRLPVRTFGRLKNEWLHLLPGQGRSSLLSVAAQKIAGFSKTLPLAH
jgi:peptidoglycan/xylan/chitin deacetylase (PgdA/CDA1 family)